MKQSEVKEIYRIKKDDSIESVCQTFKIDKLKLLLFNKIDNFECGKLLLIPFSKTYVVKPGDSLQSIAQENCVKEEDLKNQNKCSNVFIGQILKIK